MEAIASIAGFVDNVQRVIAIGVLAGTFVAYRRYQRYQHRRNKPDPFPTIARWTMGGVVAGLIFELIRRLV